MGVAENKSYKDQYHFKETINYTEKDMPSLNLEPKINTNIKKNPFRSNVEIEGGEVVLQPDLSALFKAVGKRHSKGGMDVLLKPDSFVFSDYDKLKFTPKELELFELKEGGTPADVLQKNIKLKHCNMMVQSLDDPFKDDIAKRTSAMMLEKYIKTIGNIAYVQEQKKGLPDGIPEFALDTAPVYDPELKADILANKQYMKAGGKINPFLQAGGPNRPDGMRYSELRSKGRLSKAEQLEYQALSNLFANRNDTNTSGFYPLTQRTNTTSTPSPYDWRNNPQQPAPSTGRYDDTIIPPAQNPQTAAVSQAQAQSNWGVWGGGKLPIFQNRYGVSNAADKIGNLDELSQQLGYTGPKDNKAFQQWLYNSSPENKAVIDKWHNKYNQGPTAGMFDSKIGIRWQNAINEIMNRPKPAAPTPTPAPIPKPKAEVPGPAVPDLNITPQGSKQADWRFTPWQQLDQLSALGHYANVKRYMPYRSRYNATYTDPALVNPEQAIGDIKGMANQQLSSLTTLNPILRNAQAASIAGQVMNQAPGLRSQYDNQNAQILNQSRQYNNQVKNNESLVNMANDQQYYQQAVEGRKNFDNYRDVAFTNYENVLKGQVQTNQKLAYNLLTQNNPAYGFDWRSGNFTRNPKSILDAANPSNQQENLLELARNLKNQGYGEKLIGDIIKTKAFQNWQPAQTPNFMQKKGGKVKRNPFK